MIKYTCLSVLPEIQSELHTIPTENEINHMNTKKKKKKKKPKNEITYTPGVGGGLPGLLAAGTRRLECRRRS
jgi:malic enzyme